MALAIEAYGLAVENYPARHEWRLTLAHLLYDAGQRPEAVAHYESLYETVRNEPIEAIGAGDLLEKLVELQPEKTGLRIELAEHYARNGRVRDAVTQFERLAGEALEREDCDESVALYERALALDATRSDLIAQAADLLELMDQPGKAARYLEQLAELNRRESDGSKNIPVLERLLAYDPLRDDLHAELAGLFELEGDIDRAIRQRHDLARLYAQAGDREEEVIEQCLKICALSPEYIPAREQLIESWLKVGDIAQAKAELQKLGELALENRELDRAEGYFHRCREIDPDDIGNTERLAKLLEVQGKTKESIQARRQVLDLYIQAKETAQAIRILLDLRRFMPDDLQLHQQLARMMMNENGKRREAGEEWLGLIDSALGQGQIDVASQAIGEARPGFASDWPWRTRLAQTLAAHAQTAMATHEWTGLAQDAIEERQYDTAREAAGEGLRGDSESIGLRVLRAEANRRLSNYDTAARDLRCLAERLALEKQYAQSEQYLEQAIELNPRNNELLHMLAETQLTREQPEKALATFGRLCDLYRQENKLPQAIEQAQRMVNLDPSEERKDHLAGLMVAAGQTAQAVAVWREIAERLAADGETDAAFSRLSRILEVKDGDIDTLRQMADLTYETGGMLGAMSHFDRLMEALIVQGDLEAIEGEYHRILEMEPGHLLIKERLADFLFEQGRAGDAVEMFRAIAQTFCDEQDQPGEALRVLRHLKAIAPDNLTVREQEAALLEKMGRSDEATQILRQIAAILRRSGQLDQSIQTLTYAAELDNEKADLQLEVAELFQQQGDSEQATRFLLRAIEIHDRNEQLGECIAILEKAIELNPMRLDLPDALARIYERLGLPAKARDQWLELGEIHEIQDEREAAENIYRHLCELMPRDAECRRRLASLLEDTGNRAEALRHLQTLADLAGQDGDAEHQVQYLQRMLTLEPGNETTLKALTEVWIALDREDELFETLSSLERIYTADRRYEEAIQALQSLKELRPDEPELMDRTIELLIKTGHTEEAATQGIELIKVHFNRGDDPHALETVRRIIEIQPDHIERRIMLARLIHENDRPEAAQQEFFLTASKLFGEGNHESCHQVCEAGLELFADDVHLRDLAGRVLLKLGRTQDAIEVQLHLALRHDQRGEEAKAGRVFEMILEARPDDHATLEAMVEWSLRHNRDANAVGLLIRLAESHYLAGETAMAIEKLGRAQALDASRLDLKIRLAEIQMEAGDEEAACANWKDAAAGLLEQKQADKAVEILTRLHQIRPDDLVIMARLGEAHQRCGQPALHRQTMMELGDRFLAGQMRQDALRVFEALSTCHGADPEIWERLASLYADLDNPAGAIQAYRHLAELHRTARRFDQARQCLVSANWRQRLCYHWRSTRHK